MHRFWLNGACSIVLATSAAAQMPRISGTLRVDLSRRDSSAYSAQRIQPLLATQRFSGDTANTRSRRRQIIGAAVGAIVGGTVGGTYAFLEDSRGCKVEVGIPCTKRRYLGIYPVGGAIAGAAIGALIARF